MNNFSEYCLCVCLTVNAMEYCVPAKPCPLPNQSGQECPMLLRKRQKIQTLLRSGLNVSSKAVFQEPAHPEKAAFPFQNRSRARFFHFFIGSLNGAFHGTLKNSSVSAETRQTIVYLWRRKISEILKVYCNAIRQSLPIHGAAFGDDGQYRDKPWAGLKKRVACVRPGTKECAGDKTGAALLPLLRQLLTAV
jgi:hypothetical protein